MSDRGVTSLYRPHEPKLKVNVTLNTYNYSNLFSHELNIVHDLRVVIQCHVDGRCSEDGPIKNIQVVLSDN